LPVEIAAESMAHAGQPSNGLSVLGSDDDESFGRDLQDMLRDGAKVAEVDGDLSVQGDIGTGMLHVGGGTTGSQSYRPNSLPSGIAGGYVRSQTMPPGIPALMKCFFGFTDN